MHKLKLLEKALRVAVNAHFGQEDKAGKPYILHPIRVSETCLSVDEKIVALLHDTIEDTNVTKQVLLEEGFPQYIVDAVNAMTKEDGEEYAEYIKRLSANPIASKVKINDIIDNLDASRLSTLEMKDIERMQKYITTLNYLKSLKL